MRRLGTGGKYNFSRSVFREQGEKTTLARTQQPFCGTNSCATFVLGSILRCQLQRRPRPPLRECLQTQKYVLTRRAMATHLSMR